MLLLAFYFTGVFFYAQPLSLKNDKARFYSQYFLYPYFHQSWNLFAPIPTSNYKLYCQDKNSGLQPTDVFYEIRTIHQSNRFKGYGPLLVAFSNSIHYFEQDAIQLKTPAKIDNTISFKILEHSVKNYLQATRKVTISDLKLVLVIEDSHSSKQKVYFN